MSKKAQYDAAFQGVPGAYSQLALRQLLGKKACSLACESFDEVFKKVEAGLAHFGILPIENSLAGSIHQNYDLLVKHSLTIQAETYLRVEHCLLGGPGASLKTLTQVRSHPQALAQCSDFFHQNPAIKPVAYYDTAGAAESIYKEKDPTVGAIASAYAGELYRLNILKKNLENLDVNYTRFLLVSPEKDCPTAKANQKMKTSIFFIPSKNFAGILFRILGVFALRDIDLTKIESRPQVGADVFQYQFYADLIGDPRRDISVQKALEHLKEMTKQQRILGTYPAEKTGRK